MGNMSNNYFILSCARSGSTSLTRILDTADNGICASEPMPNLNWETREAMEGRLLDLHGVIDRNIVPRVKKALQTNAVYGEKNVTYGPFITELYNALNCKFVFLKRDGRDVVRSLINWHEQKFGTIYRECRDSGNLAPEAIFNATNLPVHLDTSDYSRPRPQKDDPFYHEWEQFSRAEMCAFYWARINELYIKQLSQLPKEAWIEINYTGIEADNIIEVADFLELKCISKPKVQSMLDNKINSLTERGSSEGTYPDWKNWNSEQRQKFDRVAGKIMYDLGYYNTPNKNWFPKKYGDFWQQNEGGLEWYTWMYDYRQELHKEMVAWIQQRESEGDAIFSIADFGCGLGVGYCDDFADKKYIGADISEKNIRWCQKHRKNSNHEYYHIDFVSESLKEPVDLVFSSGTLDNTYDIDIGLKNMVKNAKKWIYVTFYRGWFPELKAHQYSWNEEHKCFYNDVSPSRIHEVLLSLGCQDIQIKPIPTEHADIPYETLVIARVR
jgi:hypothetical protein